VELIREAYSHAFLAGPWDFLAQRDMWTRRVAGNLQKPNVPFARPAQWRRIHATPVGKLDLDLTATIVLSQRGCRENVALRGYDDAVARLNIWYLDLDDSGAHGVVCCLDIPLDVGDVCWLSGVRAHMASRYEQRKAECGAPRSHLG
jgi:hypothetical protein